MAPQHSNRKPVCLPVVFYPGGKSQAITSLVIGCLESDAHLRSRYKWVDELGHVAWNLTTRESEWASAINMLASQLSIRPQTWRVSWAAFRLGD